MPKCWSRVSRKQVKAVRQQQSCYEKKKKWWWIWHHDYPSLHTHIYVSGFRLVFLNTFDFLNEIYHTEHHTKGTQQLDACTVLLHLQLAMKMSFLCFNVRKNIVPRKLLFVVSFHDFIVVDFPIWCTQKHFYIKWNWTKQSFHYFNDNFLLSERGFFFFCMNCFPPKIWMKMLMVQCNFSHVKHLFLFRYSFSSVVWHPWTQPAWVKVFLSILYLPSKLAIICFAAFKNQKFCYSYC